MAAPALIFDVHEDRPTTAVSWVTLIRDTAAAQRSTLIDDFHRWAQPTVRRITAGILREMRLDRNTWFDDIESSTAEAMFLLVIEVVEDRTSIDELVSFEALLTYRARSKAREFLDSSGGLNQASGQVGLKRRVKEMRWTLNHLTQTTGRVPSAQEVVEATNARMEEKRKDFRRQGMECSLEDYAYLEMGPAASLENTPEPSVADPNENPAPLHAAERLDFIAMIIARCAQHSEILAQVAEVWLDPATQSAYDGHPSASDVAPLVGLAPQTCRTKIALVREYARQVLKDFYGITGVEETSEGPFAPNPEPTISNGRVSGFRPRAVTDPVL
ncbi:hypothetical protein [Nocardioides sp. Leaf285]|uniref:hypothetical protein n=1 Tax=Nocardioides sp. Leaf285 TaxID=1736322 RepID=UPI000702AC13|nr:hypothetical protein [Nocardioides sp. Leaf285]KQP63013.1 hypothetical protein ASF47_18550 [Nocardioides sp. Leaf285]